MFGMRFGSSEFASVFKMASNEDEG